MRPLTMVRSLALALLIAAPAAAQTTIPAECQPLLAASDKQYTVPSHAFLTSNGLGPTPMQSEVINIGGVAYVKAKIGWVKSPLTSEQLAQQSKEKAKSAKVYTCKQLPDEAINGVPANVYSSHIDFGTDITDSQFWIVKSTGLPARSEIEMNRSGHKTHVSVRFEYENVKAPEGAK